MCVIEPNRASSPRDERVIDEHEIVMGQ